MITALAHCCIFSRDLEKTKAFYTVALGLEVAFRFLKDGKEHGYYFKVADRQFIEVFLRDEAPADGPHPIAHFTLETDDIQHLHDELSAKGIEVSEPKMGADQSWQMWLSDPDGTRIEIHQYTPESFQFTGQDCIVNW